MRTLDFIMLQFVLVPVLATKQQFAPPPCLVWHMGMQMYSPIPPSV